MKISIEDFKSVKDDVLGYNSTISENLNCNVEDILRISEEDFIIGNEKFQYVADTFELGFQQLIIKDFELCDNDGQGHFAQLVNFRDKPVLCVEEGEEEMSCSFYISKNDIDELFNKGE